MINSYHNNQYHHTLSNLAVTFCTNLQSYYKNYPDVFNNDCDFINTLNCSALEQKGLFQCAEDVQRTALTDSYFNYALTFLHPLENLYGSYIFLSII